MNNKVCKTILVVDDNPVILKLMENLLINEGHNTVCVQDEFGFIDALVDLVPDIIFLDLIMPKIDGADLCRIVRNIETLQACYVVIVSAAIMEHKVDYKEIGADYCIAKGPFKEMSRHILQVIEDTDKPRSTKNAFEIKGVENIHERQVTKELLQKNDRLRVILEGMSQGIVELDRSRIVYVNPQAAQIIGKQREALLGTDIRSQFPGTLLKEISETRQRFNASRHFFESSPITLGMRKIVVEQFTVSNGTESIILMLSDVTERKRMEAIIEATNLTENLGYVFSGIRHEIGNPVNSIKVALSVLQSNLQEYDLDTIEEFLDRSQQEISRIEYLLLALKNFSLFEKPQVQELSGKEFINDFVSLVRSDFLKKKIKIQTLLPENDFTLLVDGRALHHIMLNLFTNAADAVENVQQPAIAISVTEMAETIKIKVDDNGVGISTDEQKNLFRPFYTSKISGTGLGLVIVKKLINAMNGAIRIESYEGIGTTVVMTIPGKQPEGM